MAARCKKCGAPIIWIKTPKGKWIHCDEGLHEYRADDDGPQVLINDSGKAIRCRLTFLGKADGLARIAHWATCPNADDFRKRGGGK